MEIKRKFEMVITTNRRYIVRQSASGKPTVCAKCGEPVLMTEQTAEMVDITQRRDFRITETDAGAVTKSKS